MMEIFEYTVLPENADLLKQKIENFDFSNPPIDPEYLSKKLFYAMEKENAVGLSSNQIGLPYRAFVMSINGIDRVCFNPEIITTSNEKIKDIEGCISFPDLWLSINRPINILARYQDKNGIFVNETFENFVGRVYCHETDHLNGIRFIDLVGPVTLSTARSKRMKKLKRKYNDR